MRFFSTFLILTFLFPQTVFASDVVLNEFLVDSDSDQWVELYNSSNESLTISGWIIDDSGGSEQFIIPNDTIIEANGFRVFESNKFHLNTASQDTLQLVQGSVVIDSFVFDRSPGKYYSYGRIEDGIGLWGVFDSPSKGMTNTSVSPVPSATPTLIPTEVPSKTPTPTKTPYPTKIPTIIPDSPTAIVIPSVTPVLVKTYPIESIAEDKDGVLGVTIADKIPLVSPFHGKKKAAHREAMVLSSSENTNGGWFVGIGGILLLACGILASYTKRNHGNLT